MKYAFFGTPEFAAIILEKLIEAKMPPAVVITNPDKPVGRKKIITPPPVKQTILNYKSKIKDKIKILQPEKLTPSLLSTINSSWDFFIVAAYSKILPQEIINIPRLGVIGVHPSLLPKYRGPSPIQSAILNGEKKTGVTLFMIDEKIDHGPIIAQKEYILVSENDQYSHSPKATYETLMKKLAELSADLLIETVPKLIKGKIKPKQQDHSKATYTKKFTSDDAYIDQKMIKQAEKIGGEAAIKVDRKVRALNPKPGTWTTFDGVRTKILETEIINGKLKIKTIQKAGKKPLLLS